MRIPFALVVLALVTTAVVAADDAPIARWVTVTEADGLPSSKTFAVLVDRDRVWVGTEAGLAAVDRASYRVERVLTEADGLPFDAVTALALDPSSGDLWIGTMGGLARLSAGRIDAYTQLDSGLANNVIYGVAVDGPDVWVATAAGLSRFRPGTGAWEIFDTTNTLMHEPWTYAVTASGGAVYVAVWGSGVVVRDSASGSFRVHRDPDGEMEIDLFRDDGLVHDVTSAIAVDGHVMWVGTYFGLSRYDGRRWQSYSTKDSGLAGDFINFVRAGDGLVWIATDQGVSRFDSETWHTWRRNDGRRPEHVTTTPDGRRSVAVPTSIFASDTVYGIDTDGDDVWLATAAGLSHGIAAEQPHRRGDRP